MSAETVLNNLLEEGEKLISNEQFVEAHHIYTQARDISKDDVFIIQRQALSVFKSEKPDIVQSLHSAREILNALNPDKSINAETLGLSGAIYKRLYEETKDRDFIELSLNAYLRGMLLTGNYYNGVNVAYLYLLNASVADHYDYMMADYINSKRAREKTKNICLSILLQSSFIQGDEKIWVLLSLAELESYSQADKTSCENYVQQAIDTGASSFQINAFRKQQDRIHEVLKNMNLLY